jgi:hypothetical protein
MDPQLSAAAIALLFGAAKIGLIGTVGFAIAWFRARDRIRRLEAQASPPSVAGTGERLDRIEETMEYVAAQLDRIAATQEEVRLELASRNLPPTEGR